MSTGQNYVAGGGNPCPNEQTVKEKDQIEAQEASSLPRFSAGIQLSERGERIVIPAMRFIDNIHDPQQMNQFRDAVRSWFCCWVPSDVQEGAHGPGEDEGIELFQDLDMFFSDLIEAGLKRQKQELRQLRDYREHVINAAGEAVMRTRLIDNPDDAEAKEWLKNHRADL